MSSVRSRSKSIIRSPPGTLPRKTKAPLVRTALAAAAFGMGVSTADGGVAWSHPVSATARARRAATTTGGVGTDGSMVGLLGAGRGEDRLAAY